MTPRSMVEGALLAVITAILALIGTFLPIASFFTFLVVAVPIIVANVRNTLLTGILASFVAAFLVATLTGPITAMFFYLQFMVMALAYGYLFKNKYSSGKILAVGTFVAALSTILIIALTMLVGQIGLEQQKQALFEAVDRTMNIYEEYGMLEQFKEQGISKEQLHTMLTDMVKLFIRVLPAFLIIGSVFTAVTHFIMARVALKRLGHDIPNFPPFSQWHLPWYTVWGLIGGWISYLLGDIYSQDILRIIGQNILIAYAMVLLVLGMSVIAFYIKKFQVSRINRLFMLLAIIFMFNGFVVVTLLIGMFDLVLDHRKLKRKAKND